MKAIRVYEFGGPDVMKLENVPDPKPVAGQVLVRLHAVGINPVDTYVRAGTYTIKPTLPFTPGSDGAGVIEAIGDGVKQWKRGDRVYIFTTASGIREGAYAQFALCTASQVHSLADNATFPQGAAIGVPYSTAYRALFQKAQAVHGETVFIHGASGGVGIAAVQLAVAHGLRVIGTASTERGQELVKQQGAQHVLDHHAPDYLEKLTTLTDGRGPEVILEMLANVNLGKDLAVLAPHGRVVIIGNRGTIEINPRAAMQRDATILSMMLPNASDTVLASIHAALVAGLATGSLKPVISQELPLKDAPRAHELLMQPGAYGKIVLIP
ncbi:MAG TPA: NADPH:quinone reductase [Verrucomicrobiae bacterium]|nr:NADPH:quinone reductase [Verrucomicrobiae bacterium]